eukprot:ctg_208.g127
MGAHPGGDRCVHHWARAHHGVRGRGEDHQRERAGAARTGPVAAGRAPRALLPGADTAARLPALRSAPRQCVGRRAGPPAGVRFRHVPAVDAAGASRGGQPGVCHLRQRRRRVGGGTGADGRGASGRGPRVGAAHRLFLSVGVSAPYGSHQHRAAVDARGGRCDAAGRQDRPGGVHVRVPRAHLHRRHRQDAGSDVRHHAPHQTVPERPDRSAGRLSGEDGVEEHRQGARMAGGGSGQRGDAAAQSALHREAAAQDRVRRAEDPGACTRSGALLQGDEHDGGRGRTRRSGEHFGEPGAGRHVCIAGVAGGRHPGRPCNDRTGDVALAAAAPVAFLAIELRDEKRKAAVTVAISPPSSSVPSRPPLPRPWPAARRRRRLFDDNIHPIPLGTPVSATTAERCAADSTRGPATRTRCGSRCGPGRRTWPRSAPESPGAGGLQR